MKLYTVYLVLFTVSSNSFVLGDSSDKTLELVQVLFRHGARGPTKDSYDFFHFNDLSAYKPYGLDQLTIAGREQEYRFGLFLRDRYSDYLSSEYKNDDLYAYSTDVDRTKMSLELVLAGLYPPQTNTGTILDQLNWQPIPYRYTPKELDVLLLPYVTEKFRKLYRKVIKSKEFQDEASKFSKLIDHLADVTGLDIDKNSTQADRIHSVLQSDEYLNLTLPHWYTAEVKRDLEKYHELVQSSFAFTDELTKVVSGPIIKTFVENMNLNEKVDNPRKMYLYSAHGYNLISFIKAHNNKELSSTAYGSALVLEKLRDQNNKLYVRLLFWNGAGEMITLKLGDHEEFCPVDEYLKLIRNMIPSDEEIYSHLENIDTSKLKKFFFEDSALQKN